MLNCISQTFTMMMSLDKSKQKEIALKTVSCYLIISTCECIILAITAGLIVVGVIPEIRSMLKFIAVVMTVLASIISITYLCKQVNKCEDSKKQ